METKPKQFSVRPRYYQTYKEKLRRLFGIKVPFGFREELLARVERRHLKIQQTATLRALRDIYDPVTIKSLVFAKNPLLEMIGKSSDFIGAHIRVPLQ